MNQQPIEKQTLHPNGMLEIHSMFYTIQGEGPFVGQPAIFVRLAGCNLQCPLCDTDYTSDRRLCGPLGLLELLNEIHETCRLVVITGGEPFRQNLTPAVTAMLAAGYRVQVESNGTLYLPGFPYEQVTTVVSPKAGMLNRSLVTHPGAIKALKYVIQGSDHMFDGLPALALQHPAAPFVARPPEGFTGPVYIQPADEKDPERNAENLKAAVQSASNYGYTLGIQVHKLIGKE